ncbi:MAG TPA: ribosome maturation factor RimM [Acidimicrobiia bacterium]
MEVGRVGRPHGLRGEVAVTFTSNRPERWQVGSVLYAGTRELTVTAARPHLGRMLLCFQDVDDRGAAEQLRGLVLSADPLVPTDADLDDDEMWVHELVGCTVVDRNDVAVGEVVAVEANPAHDLLVLDEGGLIPVVFIVEHGDGRVVVDLPAGLLEL